MRRSLVLALVSTVAACGSGDDDVPFDAPIDGDGTATIVVALAGDGSGRVTSSPAGIDCGDDCVETYPAGTAVSLAATPSAGSTFTGWSGGGCSGTGPCAVTPGADLTITATFLLPPFFCADDSATEPNNDVQVPFITPVAQAVSRYTLAGLAICPAGDVDHYRFEITAAGQNFEATLHGVAGRPPLSLEVLNAAGTLLAAGASVPGAPHEVHVELINRLAVGAYLVRVRSPSSIENNYDLTLGVCAQPFPCP